MPLTPNEQFASNFDKAHLAKPAASRHLYGPGSQGREARRSPVQQVTKVELIINLKTAKTAPPPDQAKPIISTYPLPGSFSPAEGRVITDFGAHSKWYQRDLPPRSALGIE